ncbi:PadR family transcriptional regulator [Paenibacillus pini]|uniref:PadR-family transcriptional regulator n=1 Tax=Paenibacillus pini JCM 16418 TaxID=1236976 RepID=W7YED6_9BACL|nr:PadR family transcriptional regulator [Paenibacillus pini]GAF09290.1 PadR-family transcriptional regulator [Paenibacillus pini JCM 16418]
MNTLGYAILSVLARRPCSGYQLSTYLEVLWPAKHSQIYPLLTKMEQKGFLAFEHVEQTGKPDKKIFSITEAGKEALALWMKESPSDRIVRDEFLIKMYSMWFTDEENAKKLIHDRISKLKRKVSLREKKIIKVENEGAHHASKHFGRYVLLNRSNFLDKEEISWCNWVLKLISNTNFFKLVLGFLSAGTLNQINQSINFFGELPI